MAIHPAAANASILKYGLDPVKAQTSYVYVTRMQYFRNLGLEPAADNVMVESSKWLSQPVTLWEVENTAQNIGNLQPYFGPGLGNVPQWVSSAALTVIQHVQR